MPMVLPPRKRKRPSAYPMRMLQKSESAVAPTVTTTTPGVGPGGFGAANQVVIGTDLTVAFNHTGEKDESTFSLAPALRVAPRQDPAACLGQL